MHTHTHYIYIYTHTHTHTQIHTSVCVCATHTQTHSSSHSTLRTRCLDCDFHAFAGILQDFFLSFAHSNHVSLLVCMHVLSMKCIRTCMCACVYVLVLCIQNHVSLLMCMPILNQMYSWMHSHTRIHMHAYKPGKKHALCMCAACIEC